MAKVEFWNGSSFVEAPCGVRYWDGTSWQYTRASYWDGSNWQPLGGIIKVLNAPAANCQYIEYASVPSSNDPLAVDNLFVVSKGNNTAYNISASNGSIAKTHSLTSPCGIAYDPKMYRVWIGDSKKLYLCFSDLTDGTGTGSIGSPFGDLTGSQPSGASAYSWHYSYVDPTDKLLRVLDTSTGTLPVASSFSIDQVGYPTGLTSDGTYYYVLSGTPDTGNAPSDVNTVYKFTTSGSLVATQKIGCVSAVMDLAYDTTRRAFWMIDKTANKIYLIQLRI